MKRLKACESMIRLDFILFYIIILIIFSTINKMAKKVKNAKLIHPKSNINTANKVPDVKSAFSNFS
jgi:hypothetical protein